MPTTTGETARGRSTKASSSQAPGKRWRARMRATPDAEDRVGGHGDDHDQEGQPEGMHGVGRGHGVPGGPQAVLEGPVEDEPDGQDHQEAQ